MIELAIAAGLLLALVAVVVLALTMPRRVAREVARVLAAEQAKEANRALMVKASEAELEAIVGTARLLLNDQAEAVEAIRALGAWGTDFASACYAQASAASGPAGIETVRKPEVPPPVSRERPATAPRGEAPQPSAPERAAGLHRPRILAAGAAPHPPPVWVAAKTLPSMKAVHAPTLRPEENVVVELRRSDGGEGAS